MTKSQYISETIAFLEKNNIITFNVRYSQQKQKFYIFIDNPDDLSDFQAIAYNKLLIDYLKENADSFATYDSCIGEYIIDNCIIRYWYDEE